MRIKFPGVIILFFSLFAIAAVPQTMFAGNEHIGQSVCVSNLRDRLLEYVHNVDADVGIALITSGGDTLVVNNDRQYPLMSVFKLHQALAVASKLDGENSGLDSVLQIRRSELNPQTWSPMFKEHTSEVFSLSVSQLLEYILQQSDNNASNLLFARIASVEHTDSFIRTTTGIQDFRLCFTEEQMQRDHSLSRKNWSTPLACAQLMMRVLSDTTMSGRSLILSILRECKTGADRLKKAIEQDSDVVLYHKTGSGYRDDSGLLMAHNDIGYFSLPDGSGYALAVLVKDFDGTEEQASALIAGISRIVYAHMQKQTK